MIHVYLTLTSWRTACNVACNADGGSYLLTDAIRHKITCPECLDKIKDIKSEHT